jgi:purine catabolism regulator
LLPGASVAVSDQAGQVLAFAGDMAMLQAVGVLEQENLLDVSRLTVGLHDDGSRKWAVGAIRAATMHHGFVVAVEGSQPFGPVAGTAVDQMAVVAALEITRDLAVAAVERQFASNVLHELVTSAEPDAPGAATRGQSFGWDLDRPVAVLVCRHEDEPGARRNRRQRHLAAQRAIEAWTSAVRSRDRKAATAGFTTELVAIIGATPDPEAIARAVQAEISALTRRMYSIGVSQPAEDHTAIPLAYQQARSALTLGRRVSGPGSVTGFGGLGLFRLLTQVSETDLSVFVEDTLGPVLALDSDQRDDLLRTLEVLLEQHLNVAESSRILHYHYNTLRYRITKLEKLLGPFSSEPPIALRLAVALQILRMHEMSATRR